MPRPGGQLGRTVRPQSGPQRPLDADEQARVLDMRARGMGFKAIARALGRGTETIKAAYEEIRP